MTQNGDIYCMYLFESHGKWLIVMFYVIISLNISVQTFSEKYNTKKKRWRGTNWRGGALNGLNTIHNSELFRNYIDSKLVYQKDLGQI